MKKFLAAAITGVFLFGNCSKEDPVASVSYSISESSPATPQYQIEYTSDQAGGTTVTSNNSTGWSSGKVTLKQGQFVMLKCSCSDPEYTLHLNIFVNGNLWKTASFSNAIPSLTLSGNVPTG